VPSTLGTVGYQPRKACLLSTPPPWISRRSPLRG